MRQEISFNFSIKCLQDICLLCFFVSQLGHPHTPKVIWLPMTGRDSHQPDSLRSEWQSHSRATQDMELQHSPALHTSFLAGSVRDTLTWVGVSTAQNF